MVSAGWVAGLRQLGQQESCNLQLRNQVAPLPSDLTYLQKNGHQK